MALPALISVEDMFGSPERTRPLISPDGAQVAFLAPWKNQLNVWLQDLDTDTEPRCVTNDETRSVIRYEWADDPRWLLYLQDVGGDENWHLYRVDLDSPDADAVDLTPFPGDRVISFEPVAGRPGKRKLVIGRAAGSIETHELDIASGEIVSMEEDPEHLAALRMAEESEWLDGTDYPLGVFPTTITPDRTGMWIGSHLGTDRTRLVRVDLATGEGTEVDSHPTHDIDTRSLVFPTLPPPLIQDRQGELLGVRYLGERQVIHALDPHFAEVLENLEKLSEGDLSAMSTDESGQRWVVTFTHDRDPGVTWFYDHATGESRLLFRPYPHLDPEVLAPMRPVTITARDGLKLPSYLTLPVGLDPVGLPMVLLVHGGPWARDSWGFDHSVQLLANRGYAVLQVNFRGSTGFGKAHMEAAIGEFAGKMHDDLIDGVDWAVAQGYADPDRVAIFGGSYGGYATLVGVTFTPDRFAAAVGYVGVSNLANYMRTQPVFLRPALVNNWYRYVGDPDVPEQEADMLARSPISRIDEIRTPLMLVQGANDSRVVRDESDQIAEGLRARGVDIEYIVFDDEGHGFVHPKNLITMFDSAERFLAEHLGGRTEQA